MRFDAAKALSLLVLVAINTPLVAQQPLIESWISSDGTAAEGAYHSYDPLNKSVRLLFLHKVPLSKLSAGSQNRVLELAKSSDPPKQEPVETSPPAELVEVKAKEIAELNLSDATIADWFNVERESKKRYCQKFLIFLLAGDVASRDLRNQLLGSDGLDGAAENLEVTTMAFFKLLEERPESTFRASQSKEKLLPVMLELAKQMKWLNRYTDGSFVSEEISVRGLKIVHDDGDYTLLGEILSHRKKPSKMVTLNFGFYEANGAIDGLETMLVMDLVPLQPVPFKTTIYDPSFVVSLESLKLTVTNIIELD